MWKGGNEDTNIHSLHICPSDLGEYKNFENYAFSKFLYFKMVKLKIGMSQSG